MWHGVGMFCASLPPVMSAAALDMSSILVVLMVAVVVAAVVGWSVAATVLHRDRAPTTAAGDAGPGPDVAAQVAAQVAAGQADLAAKREVIATQLDQMRGQMRADLERLERVVTGLGQRTAEQFGQVDGSLRLHAEATAVLAATTGGLREALANPKVRGQWGERMAEDVLRLAGFVEHVNYRKQTAVQGDGRGIPDFTFFMPKGHVLYMDVKFPITAYLRHCEATTDAERLEHRAQFLRDVRLRVRELARREYQQSTDGPVVEQVLLFLPNETISSFIFEHDPSIVDDALRQRVVLCSPVTLFAYLGLIRPAFDSFMVEATSDQILALLGRFDDQWSKYTDSIDAVRRRLEGVPKEFEQLAGTRRRAVERPLREIEALRRERGLPVAELSLAHSLVEVRDEPHDGGDRAMVAPPA